MGKEKEVKTNAMRILDKLKISYKVNHYECDEFIDGVHIADMLGQSYDSSFKTLVLSGKSKNYYVFALPIDKELDMKKAARVVGEKSLEMVHVKDINAQQKFLINSMAEVIVPGYAAPVEFYAPDYSVK
ncbi:MAG: hypothetical protein IJO91_03480, partial [Oscillospiraceae bacterium]|nr:hypothetical protein [Oscillospiraceae bacterium]